MADRTKIEWTRGDDGTPGATWNPVTGCTRVSPGCENCYIDWAPPFRIEHRHFTVPCSRCGGSGGTAQDAGTCRECDGEGRTRSNKIGSTTGVRLHPERLEQPLRWRKPRRVFVNSLSDLFHDEVPDEYIAQVWAVMAMAPQHTFMVLTKRHGRMCALLNSKRFIEAADSNRPDGLHPGDEELRWPLPNVWLGVTVEDQQRADLRIPDLLDTPAAVRFVSCEPLLGPINLAEHLSQPDGIGWVIVGGESGKDARPMHPRWARSLRDQCTTANVPFFFKQRGEWTWNEPGHFRIPTRPYTDRVAVMHPAGMTAMTKSNPFNPFERGHPNWATRIERVGKKRAGRELDGRTWDETPKDNR